MRRAGLVAMVAVVLPGLAGCEEWALDRRMVELCRMDGGLQVFETVTLPPSAFDAAGRVITSPATRRSDRVHVSIVAGTYEIEERTDVNENGDPLSMLISDGRLLRHQTTVRRVEDRKVLGWEVGYGRSGGDIGSGHPGRNDCPKPRPDPGVVRAVIGRGV